MATGDAFADMLQGAVYKVVVGTKTSTVEASIYYLHGALLNRHSGFFRDEIANLTTRPISSNDPSIPTPSNAISLPNTNPAAFALFIRFIYQGQALFNTHQVHPFGPGTSGHAQPNPLALQSFVPPSVYAWHLGAVLCAPAFQNQALSYTYNNLGRTIFLTPNLVSWVYTYTGPDSCLFRLVLDTMVAHWSEPTNHVVKSAELNEAWIKVFSTHTELHRAFLFGLQGKKVQKAQSYMLDTQGKPIGGYHSPYGTLPDLAATTMPTPVTKKEQQQQVGLLRNLAPSKNVEGTVKIGDPKKKDLTLPVIKQEEQPMSLFKTLRTSESANDRGTESVSTPTQRPDFDRPTTVGKLERLNESLNERIAERLKKRGASSTLVQDNAKQPKLLKLDQSSSKVFEEKEVKQGGSSPAPVVTSEETDSKAQGTKTPEANGKASARL